MRLHNTNENQNQSAPLSQELRGSLVLQTPAIWKHENPALCRLVKKTASAQIITFVKGKLDSWAKH